ncbi:MAG: peptidoglycan DD-metalloendopeptidase family protein [Flavobacteriales bacterium]|nr:MAG: peptidoglycan DD-metalloendopeptidase family protein [Flavobacteriales bacterium]
MFRPLQMFCFVLCAALAFPLHGKAADGGGGTDTVAAVVQYGNEKLLEGGEALTDERLDHLLDSLCALEDAPSDMIRDLELFKRIRSLDDHGIVDMIDSLFELDTVPYALINEINLYASQMPTANEVAHGFALPWYTGLAHPADEIYGAWNTTNPNAYGPELSKGDSVVLVQLTDDDALCGFHMPVPGVLTSRFGWRDGRPHNGIDLDLAVWDTVRTMFPGVVRFSGPYGSFGRLVVVRHYNGLETFYAHLHRLKVKVGDHVDAGQLVGLGGNSGRSHGSHLHLEVRFKGVPIDAGRFIDLRNGELLCDTLVLAKTRWSYAAYPLGTTFHTVRKGDHLNAIADLYGVSIQQLCELNGISRRSMLRVGQQLLIAAR